MTAQHTPGPWAVADIHNQSFYGNNGEAFVTSADRRICEVDCITQFKRGKGYLTQCAERDANTRLIAAAPDLLADLEAATHEVEAAIRCVTDVRTKAEMQAIVARARATIAKATGQ